MQSSPLNLVTIFLLLLHFDTSSASLDFWSASQSATWLLEMDSWPVRFLANIAGYLWVGVPLALVVILAKRGLLSQKLTSNKYVRLLVWGNDVDGIPYAQLPVTINSDHHHQHSISSEFSVRSKWIGDSLRLLWCFFGLQASYLTWGLLQEKIMTQTYLIEISFFTSSGHSFHNSNSNNRSGLISISQTDTSHPNLYSVRFLNAQFLIFFCRLLAFLIATATLWYSHRRQSLSAFLLHSRQPALYLYSYCSLSNILSSWCQYEALKFVSFPVQVLSKGGKVLAVMLMSVCLGGKRYKRVEWLFALTISLGIWLFLLNEEEDVKHRVAGNSHESSHQLLLSGLVLLALYLTFDSFTSNWQAKLFEQFAPSLTSLQMMAAVNLWSLAFTSVSLSSQSELLSALRLVLSQPALLRDCLLLATASALGQLFVYHTIASFGAVVFTLIMTLRQVFAILLSIIHFGHSLTIWGVLGITIVFSSIFTNMWLKYRAKLEGGSSVRTKNKAQA